MIPDMAASLTCEPFGEPLHERLAAGRSGDVALYWLGQSGFVIRAGTYRIVIDPYLSDSLAEKYRGSRFAHQRMMPPPLMPRDLTPVDLVLCTHHHGDHMDPQTLQPLARANPDARFVVPKARMDESRRRIGVADERLLPLDAGEELEPLAGIRVAALPGAHETLDTDDAGHHLYLGYLVETTGIRILHSGDTVPYDGIEQWVAAQTPDLALLPVNGRSEFLRGNNVPGNMTLDEAVALCVVCGIPAMIAQHYGMFAFNTAEPEDIDRKVGEPDLPIQLVRAAVKVEYRLVAD
jgi:L-ascorbate metabolism protein UlaG (beta-lactamase superfamily)